MSNYNYDEQKHLYISKMNTHCTHHVPLRTSLPRVQDEAVFFFFFNKEKKNYKNKITLLGLSQLAT